LTPSRVGAIVAAPARPGYRAELARQLDIAAERIIIGEDQNTHTAALAAALKRAADHVPLHTRIVLVAAGAGITAGAALYRAGVACC